MCHHWLGEREIRKYSAPGGNSGTGRRFRLVRVRLPLSWHYTAVRDARMGLYTQSNVIMSYVLCFDNIL